MTDVIYDSRKIALMITLYVNNWGTVGCYANLLKQSRLLICYRPRKSAKIKEKSSFWLNFYCIILTLTHLTLSSCLPWWRSRCRWGVMALKSECLKEGKSNSPHGARSNNHWDYYHSSCYIFIASENVANRESRSKKCAGMPKTRWKKYDETSIIRWEKCGWVHLNGY